MHWQETLTNELANAVEARKSGNHGRARVCARRAAGWAIREYLRGKGISLDTPNAYEYIKYLQNRPDTNPEMRAVLGHFLERVQKDSPEEDAYWPLEADLIEEARWVIETLLDFKVSI